MRTRPSPSTLTPIQALWLVATGLVALLPLSLHLPVWLSLASGLLLVWRGWLGWQRRPLPPRWQLMLLVVAGCGAVGIEYRTLFGQNPGVALLVIFLALKQLESRSVRDGLAIVFLAYFIALSQFFYSQSIPTAIASLAGTLVATATLICLTDPRLGARRLLRMATLALAQATPFMLLLFLLFPRVQGPLWGLPKDAHSGLTGLSDSMAPGSISHLSQSDAIAFRARFDAAPPPQPKLYWRGPVLNDFDGRSWRSFRSPPRPSLPYAVGDRTPFEYEVTLEPHGKPWMFALDLPTRLPSDSLMASDYQMLGKEAIINRTRYRLSSDTDLRAGRDESAVVLRRALAMPAGSNPRIRELAATWRRQAAADADVVRMASGFFLRQRLTYTLTPPPLGEHSADEFLFDSKAGFCEHFAAAFAIAMRAAGVPARVVTGYQGGETNPVDGYLTVRQYDAHAWTEVWLPEQGWLRVDPTAISAPDRIELNLAAAVPEGEPLPLLMRAELSWLRDLRFRWDALNNGWNQWVLGYNPERQRALLRRLGMPAPDWQSMTIALTIFSGLTMLALTAWVLRRRHNLDAGSRLWARVSRRLAPLGLGRRPDEGPLAYADRVATARPPLAGEIRRLASLYGRVRYGRAGVDELAELKRRVASFRP